MASHRRPVGTVERNALIVVQHGHLRHVASVSGYRAWVTDLILLTGPPGAGKSTVDEIIERLHAGTLDLDGVS